MSLPPFLRSEPWPYASVTVMPAVPVVPVVEVAIEVAIVPVLDQPAGPVVDVAIVPIVPVQQPDVANATIAARWYAAHCPSWRKGGAQ